MTEMAILPGPGARYTLEVPQQRWRPNAPDAAGILELARFAGQEMMASSDDNGGFTLLYLGFTTKGFGSMAAAQAAGPEFARRVLAYMAGHIADQNHENA